MHETLWQVMAMNERALDFLMGSFRDIPVVTREGGYRYFVHPLSDGIPLIDLDVLEAAAWLVSEEVDGMGGADLLVTAESMGIPLTTAVSMMTGIPYSIVRKRSYGLEGEIGVAQKTGYSSSELHVLLPEGEGDVIILDDVLSTGGTLRALAEGVGKASRDVKGAVILFNKMGRRSAELSRQLGFPIVAILDVEVSGKGCTVVPAER